MLPVCKYAILILIISILLLHFRLSSPANIHQRLLQFLRPEGMSILIVLSMYSNHYTQQVYTCKFKRLYITSYFFLFSPPVSLFLSLSLPFSFYLSIFLSISLTLQLVLIYRSVYFITGQACEVSFFYVNTSLTWLRTGLTMYVCMYIYIILNYKGIATYMYVPKEVIKVKIMSSSILG